MESNHHCEYFTLAPCRWTMLANLFDFGFQGGRLAMIAGRLELPTVRFAAWCSIQLGYAIKYMVVEGLEPSITSV